MISSTDLLNDSDGHPIYLIMNYYYKLKVMKAKSSLKGDVFISDDLIKKDQFIQFKVREFAKARRKEGKDAKQGRGRVTVNGETHWWDEAAQRFISRKN